MHFLPLIKRLKIHAYAIKMLTKYLKNNAEDSKTHLKKNSQFQVEHIF